MPTPSTNTPPTPPSLSPSCPEDGEPRSASLRWPQAPEHGQQASEVGTEGHADTHPTSPGPATVATSSRNDTNDTNDTETDAMIEDEPTSAVSSRSTTVSPAPESTATAGTTPAASAPDEPDSVKQMDVDENTQFSVIDGVQIPVKDNTDDSGRVPMASQSSQADSSKDQEAGSSSPVEEDEDYVAPSFGPDFPSMRAIPTSPSLYLRAGSRFHGTQQSEKQVYDVQVEIKHVDLRESFLCGYLRIQGLTEDHPTLTTYFEGEIIGTKYSFFTKQESWGATDKIDLSHWSKFNAFRPYLKSVRKGPVFMNNVAQKENIFMRWKEHFLVPDHRVRTITGASFEGFYYICFNQVKGEVSGIYFHSKSEKFQQLELKHVRDKGCVPAIEFR